MAAVSSRARPRRYAWVPVSPAPGRLSPRGRRSRFPSLLARDAESFRDTSMIHEESQMPGPPAVPVRMTIKRERKLRQIINAPRSRSGWCCGPGS
jgi:hypothetical protein